MDDAAEDADTQAELRVGPLQVRRAAALRPFEGRWKEWLKRECPDLEAATSCGADAIAERMANFTDDKQRLVVFVAKKAFYNQLRTSTALRRKGWKTVAVVLDAELSHHQKGFFDEVIATDFLSLLLWLNRSEQAEGLRLHTQGWLFRYHLPTLIDAFKPPSCQQVVELMDLNSFLFPEQTLAQTLPHMRKAWGEQVEENQRVQCACERYLCREADGVIFPGSEDHERALGLQALGRERHYLHFLSYPLPDFFAGPTFRATTDESSPQPLRLVFAGGVVPKDERRVPELFGDAQMVTTAERILRQGLSLHVYNNPLHASLGDYPRLYADHLALEQRYPSYRFRRGAMPWDVPELLAPYDYGLIVYDYAGVLFGDEHFRNLIPSKLFMYLEAGLPVLVSERAVATAALVEAWGIGRTIGESELDHLPRILAELDHRALKRNVAEAREQLSMDEQIERLIAFYGATAPRRRF